MNIEPGATIAGRYRLERPLASGGMGAVWVARHLQLDAEVAIKFMAPRAAASPSARARFEREARAAAKLQHAHIVRVHDFGIEDDTPFLVMELLQGESLDERLKRERRLSLQATLAILTQIAKGLRRAHEAHFVHRDLKPGNIFLVRSDDDDIVKLLDFGIAKDIGDLAGSSTKTGEFMGSPHYMSPEQINDPKSIDARSDLWSLGVILFRAVTGDLPFPGDMFGVVLARVLSEPIPSPSDLVRGLPPGLDLFFQRALARDRFQRFQSVREMVEAFAVAVGVPVTPGPQGDSWSWRLLPNQQGIASVPAGATPLPPSAAHHGSPAATPRPASPALPAEFHPWTPAPAPISQHPPSSAGATPLRQIVRTVKLGAAQGPAPDPGPPRSWPGSPSQGGGPGALTVSSSARGTGALNDDEQRPGLVAQLASLPLAVRIVAMAGAVFVFIGLLVLIFWSPELPAAPQGPSPAGSEAAPGVSSSAADLAPAAPSGSAAGAEAPPDPAGAEGSGDTRQSSPSEGVAPPRKTPPKAAPVPEGKARVFITSTGGSCKVTLNAVPQGSTPLNIVVTPGPQRIYCKSSTGSVKSTQVTVAVGQTRVVAFNVK